MQNARDLVSNDVNLLVEPTFKSSVGVLQGGGACYGPRSRLFFSMNVNANNSMQGCRGPSPLDRLQTASEVSRNPWREPKT